MEKLLQVRLYKLVACIILLISISKVNAAKYTVVSNDDSGVGTLRAALNLANGNPGFDTINFNTPAPYTIVLTSGTLGAFDVFIDGTDHPAYSGLPIVAITSNGSGGEAIAINGGLGTKVKGLLIYGFTGSAIAITSVDNNEISSCIIGLDPSGAISSNANGISIVNSNFNTIGGSLSNSRNIICGNNNNGVYFSSSSNNRIINNYIGVNVDGTKLSNGGTGLLFQNDCKNNLIGGVLITERNFISGNIENGISFESSPDNIIINNFIGLDPTGVLVRGNGVHGINISSSDNIIIGGVNQDRRNVISANGIGAAGVGMGIQVYASLNVKIKLNYIGTSADGLNAMGNATHGIQIQQSPETIIGGNFYTEGNLIAASKFHGIILDESSSSSIVKGNIIGTDRTLTKDLGNGSVGIVSKGCDDVIIGGVANKEFNVCVFSGEYGILVANGSQNIIKGNFVGTDTSGTRNLGNDFGGINIRREDFPNVNYNNQILNNTIAYNGFLFPAGHPNIAQGNGPAVAISITEWDVSRENTESKFTTIRYNSIYCNAGKGIDLNQNSAGVRLGNNNKVAPRLNDQLSTEQLVVGIQDVSLANNDIDIFLMDECSSCKVNPQGKIFITTIKADGNGAWSYDYGSTIPGKLVATALDSDGNTSEFSLCYSPCNITANFDPLPSNTINLNKSNSETVNITSTTSVSVNKIDSVQYFIKKPLSDSWELYSKKDSTITFSLSGQYSTGIYEFILVVYSGGCTDSSKISISVEYFFIPNLVTPNGDELNDVFFISNTPDRFNVKMFNRWGEIVFEKNGYLNEWDLSEISDGVYFYHITDVKENDKEYQGWVHVVSNVTN